MIVLKNASNEKKVERANAIVKKENENLEKANEALKAQGKPTVAVPLITEERVRAAYLKLGGRIEGEVETYKGIPDPSLDISGLQALKVDALKKVAEKLGIKTTGLDKDEIIVKITE